ncbi:unnamed protein product [marine sediment metagenome]|uniref:Uncharacterized protein n=1 Tax=marine sediment metagenome TaxID=412755 RepID=X1BR37_9ZZZZ
MYKKRIGPTSVAAGLTNSISMQAVNGRFVATPRAGIRIKCTTDVVGGEAQVRIGQREATQQSSVPVESAAGRGPDLFTPELASAPGFQGEEVFVDLVNTTAGAVIFTYDFEQVPMP